MRYIASYILKDLSKKMVFIGGPRQSGKTTLAQRILNLYPYSPQKKGIYYNWDFNEDRQAILKYQWGDEHELIAFDELHKYPQWKNWIKGLYDKYKEIHHFLITGSARLDVYKKGGDSLLGRYHYWRLHPFTLSEIPAAISPKEAFQRLMTVGGFPEPFLDNNEREARRWRRERLDKVLKDDIRDLETVKNIQLLSLFLDALQSRVGNLISLANIGEDLEVSSPTLKHWLSVFEKMYLCFIVRPLSKNIPRSVLKAPKVYFFDNGDVKDNQDQGARFENLVANHLLKKIHFLEDRDGYRYELRFIRDKQGREIDFVIIKEGYIDQLIEVKYSDPTISKSLTYYAEKLKPRKAIQIVANLKKSYSKGKIQVQSPFEALSNLET